MAESDLVVKAFVVSWVLPCCAIIFVLHIFKRKFKGIFSAVSAYLLNKTVPIVNKATERQKKKLFSELLDQRKDLGRDLMILEIGAGGGANFAFYPPESNVTCLDPNRYFNAYLEVNSKKHRLRVNYLKGFAENMEKVESDMYDAVVCTLVLCSVRSTSKALEEVRRVLKPGGKFYFLEHVAAEKGSLTGYFQRLLNPIWMSFTGGCHITRETKRAVQQAGFARTRITPFNGKFPFVFVIRPLCMGIATK